MNLSISAGAMSDQTLEEYVDEDIAAFEKFFCTNVDTKAAALMPQEKTIIKTFIWWATHQGEVPRVDEGSDRSTV